MAPDVFSPALLTVAAKQMALFSTDQATQLGYSAADLRHRVRVGLLEHPYPFVFALTGVGWWPARRLKAAVMGGRTGAFATHRSSAWLWALTPYPQVPEITIPAERRVRPRDGLRVHRSRDLPAIPIERLGIATVSVERCLVDLGAVLEAPILQRALDRAIGSKATTPMRVFAELKALARRGREGVGPLRALLDEAGVTGSHQPSVLEAETRRLFKKAGLPQPACELVAGPSGEYRLDFPFADAMLDVEVDGWQYHSSSDAVFSDCSRQNTLTLEGYAFLRYTWRHIMREPAQVVREVRAAYQSRVGLFV
jgi:hypothetical protein